MLRRGTRGAAAFLDSLYLLLFSVLIPSAHAMDQNTTENACRANMQQINGAAPQEALDHKRELNDTPTHDDIFGADSYIKELPICPRGGEYILQ